MHGVTDPASLSLPCSYKLIPFIIEVELFWEARIATESEESWECSCLSQSEQIIVIEQAWF